MSATTSTITHSVVSTTGYHKRDFAERIRRLYPEMTKMLALVKGSNLDSMGKVAYSGKGMIKKTATTKLYHEWTIFTPIDVIYACTGGSSTTAVIADTSYFQVDDQIVNLTTNECAVVNTLTSSTTLTVTAVTGGTWSCSAGDYIAMLSSTFEEGTARYATITQEPAVTGTYLHVFREGMSMATTMSQIQSLTNEDPKAMYKADKLVHALRKVENSFWLALQATSGTTSVTIGGTAYTVYSMQGLINYAGTAINMGGTFNWENWNTVLYPQLPNTWDPNSVVYAAMGRNLASTMNQWAQNSYLTMGANSNDMRFGKKVKTYLMGGELEVEPLVLDCFDRGGLNNSILFFQSADLEYLHLKGLDIQYKENIQLNAAMAKDDVIQGCVGLKSKSNGANVKLVTNCLNA